MLPLSIYSYIGFKKGQYTFQLNQPEGMRGRVSSHAMLSQMVSVYLISVLLKFVSAGRRCESQAMPCQVQRSLSGISKFV